MYCRAVSDTDEAAVQVELIEAQAWFEEMTAAARKRRRDAVLRARDAGWSKYRIAATIGVAAPTVTSIIKAAGKGGDE